VTRVLLTNDDGIDAEGLDCMRRALLELPDVELEVIAPNDNRSATARSITIERPLSLDEVKFADGTIGYATDGTPVDCVRFAALGLIEDFQADLIVSGINHGVNLGDDITYSGTVAAAWEAAMLGLPSLAVSQELVDGADESASFARAAEFVARLVAEFDEILLPAGALLNINVPASDPTGVEVTHLGKRLYRDQLFLDDATADRRRYWIYGEPEFRHEPGTDLVAVAEGRIAVTPLRFELTDHTGMASLEAIELGRLLAPAARAIDQSEVTHGSDDGRRRHSP